MEKLIIKNAHENNLKNLNLELPLNHFVCVTGCSGSGKSSLVYDTIYAESQRSFLEGISASIFGQKLMNKPKVDSIENLRPAINISQNDYNVNPRSTVGTLSEVSYYLRSLFSLVNSTANFFVNENMFSANNPNSFCPHCKGLGTETIISKRLLIPNENLTLRDGAILLFKGSPTSKEQKFLEGLCEYYNIDINKRISELTETELNYLLYSNENIKYKITYKVGNRRKQYNVYLRGAFNIISEKVFNENTNSQIYNEFLEEVPCSICHGAKLSNEVLQYKVGELNYAQVEQMELIDLYEWVENFKVEKKCESKLETIKEIKKSILIKLKPLLELDLGYLTLSRSIPTLSNGEKQRIRISNQLTCSLKELIYIFDEPCKGLHYKDICKIIKATKAIVSRGNSVIAIEHNKKFISSSDYVIELGPVGGPKGGYLINDGVNLNKGLGKLQFKEKLFFDNEVEIRNINFRNITNQKISFPIGGITCITGVSGSGKSSLALVIEKCISGNSDETLGSITGLGKINKAVRVNHSPIGKTPRSTVVSYLGIYDEIRTIFARTSLAKEMKVSSSDFSMNLKGGRCETCQGSGLKKIEFNFLPDTFIICPDCNGKRFNNKVLAVKYKDKTICDILDSPISEIVEIFKDDKKIYVTLNNIIALGIGYLKLGQMSMNLSGGESQRIKLAKALSAYSSGKNLYIFDEPTSGLNDIDIDKFINVLMRLQKKQNTIIIIEHNIEFIAKISDKIIDFGIFGGKKGGKIAFEGLPMDAFSSKLSSLYNLNK